MTRVLQVLVVLPAILFIVMGVRWLVDPAGVAPEFGMTLQTGLGLSAQVGDLSSFFLTLGFCMLLGLVSGQRPWFYAATMILFLAAAGRTVAWLVHDAALAPEIALEVIIGIILLVAAKRLPEAGGSD
ncbi:MAG: hypothetical protein AAGI11_13115 [Pseudomonadota bacterium]